MTQWELCYIHNRHKKKTCFFSAAMFDFQGVYIVNLCIVMYVLDTKGSQKVWWVVIWTARGEWVIGYTNGIVSHIYIYVNTYCSNGYRRPVLVLPLLKQKKHASVGGQLEAPHFRGHRHMFPKRCPPYSYCCFICFVVLWVTKERRFLTLALYALYASLCESWRPLWASGMSGSAGVLFLNRGQNSSPRPRVARGSTATTSSGKWESWVTRWQEDDIWFNEHEIVTV